jgi:hypothetical protein
VTSESPLVRFPRQADARALFLRPPHAGDGREGRSVSKSGATRVADHSPPRVVGILRSFNPALGEVADFHHARQSADYRHHCRNGRRRTPTETRDIEGGVTGFAPEGLPAGHVGSSL